LANSIAIEGLHAGYGEVRVLSGISMNVQGGETVVLLGTNGNGKSTLIKCIMGQVRPTAGSIVADIDGTSYDLIGRSTEDIVGIGISLVPEGRRLFPKLTVEENLRLALVGAKASEPALELKKAYARFSILEERKNQKVRGLSGGERQMLAIARGLLGHTSLLLMDEPSEGLAPLVVRELRDSILKIKGEGVTVLLAEQNTKMALSTGDRHYILEKGEIRFEGTTESISKNGEVMMQYLGVPV